MKKLVYFIFPLFLFISCNNLLSNGDFITELSKEIEYANLEDIPVRVSTRNAAHGSIYPDGEVTVKKGYSIKLEFTLNENYTFEKWLVQDKDTKQVVTDAFSFKNSETSTSKKIITDAKLLKETRNLQIIPVCKQINDNSAPVINSDYELATSKDLLGSQNELISKKYTDWTAEDYSTLHTKSFWVKLSMHELDFEDAEKYSLKVSETLLKDSNGNTSNSTTQYVVHDVFEETEEEGTFTTEYEYPFTSGADGIVQLSFTVLDSKQNESDPVTAYVLKDTSIYSKIKILSFAENQKTYEKVKKDSENFYFSVSNLSDPWYKNKSTTSSNMDLFVVLDSQEENPVEYPVEHTEDSANYTFKIPSDFSIEDDNLFKIVIRDECKNEIFCSAPKYSASQNDFIYLYDNTNSKLKIINNNEDEELILYYSSFNPVENTTQNLSCALMKNGIAVLENIDLNHKNYYLFSQKIINGGKLGTDSALSEIKTITKDMTNTYDSSITPPDFTYEYVSAGNDGTYLFKLHPQNASDFSSLYVMAGFSQNTTSQEIYDGYNPIAIPCDGNTVMFNLETKYLAQKFDNNSPSSDYLNLILILGGIKDGVTYEQKRVINTNTLTITDNIPPKVFVEGENNKEETFDRNIIMVKKPYDRSGIQKNADGTTFFKVSYFVDGQMENTLKTITKKFNNNSNDFVSIELSDLQNADYILKPVATDSLGNQSMYGQYKHNISDGYINGKKPTFSISGNDITVKMNMEGFSKFDNYAFSADYFDSHCNDWISLSGGNNLEVNGNNISSTFYSAKDKFIRIRFYAYYYNSTDQTNDNKVLIYSEPVYYYASSDNSTTYKNVSEGFGGLTIDCDKPCLVQTYYSKKDFGTTASAWEQNCSSNKKVNLRLFDYHDVYQVDLDSIPAGYYYAVIANFSDGSRIITSVNKKD